MFGALSALSMNNRISMILAKVITFLSALFLISIAGFGQNVIQIIILILCFMLIIGLFKMVFWARYLSNLILCFSALMASAFLIPLPSESYPFIYEVIFGGMPNTILLWFITMVTSLVFLWPICIFSQNTTKFKGKFW